MNTRCKTKTPEKGVNIIEAIAEAFYQSLIDSF